MVLKTGDLMAIPFSGILGRLEEERIDSPDSMMDGYMTPQFARTELPSRMGDIGGFQLH
jgi:hypothetical protein